MFERKPEEAVVSVHCSCKDCVHNTDGYCQKDYIVIRDYQECDDYEPPDQE